MLTSADLKRMLNDDITRLKAASEKWYLDKPKVLGFPTGLPRLDTFTGGLVMDELTVLAGDPGDGKTSLMMQAVENTGLFYMQNNMPFVNLVVSAEMPKRLLVLRSACRMARVDSQELRRGNVTPSQLADFNKALEIVRGLPVLYLDHGGVTSLDVVNVVNMLQDEGIELGVIAIDYIQQLYDDGADTQRINGIMRNITRIKMDTGAAVLALSQYSLQHNKDRRPPQLGDLLGSGNIGRAADQAWLLHTPETSEQWQGEGAKAFSKDLFVRKNRNGRTGKLSLWYRPTLTQFFSSPEVEVKKAATGPTPIRVAV
jgi:replicative DNA helicase